MNCPLKIYNGEEGRYKLCPICGMKILESECNTRITFERKITCSYFCLIDRNKERLRMHNMSYKILKTDLKTDKNIGNYDYLITTGVDNVLFNQSDIYALRGLVESALIRIYPLSVIFCKNKKSKELIKEIAEELKISIITNKSIAVETKVTTSEY
jgi:hypothetical protein